jgi:DNA-binding SARP family transcriptional activator
MNTEPAPNPSAPVLALTTLGGMRLHSGEGRVLLGPGKPLALLVYLHCSPRHTANREHLLELFWRDLDPERARHALRQLLYSLRQTLGDAALDARDHDLLLTLRVSSDRDEFLDAITAGDLTRAISRYTGDFLPRFACPGGAEFEHWADLERDRLRTLFVRAAESVTRDLLSRSRFRDAQATAKRIRETKRDDQSGWRLLIEACTGARDRVHAIAEAEALEAYFAAEDRELEPATRTLLRQLRHESIEAGGGDARDAELVAELVGREEEFSAIIEAWNAARQAPARHLHIVSPAGLGKTRLLNDVSVRLQATGVRVVHLRATTGERNLPYAFAGDLASSLAGQPGAATISPASMSALVSLHPALSARFSAAPFLATGSEALRLRTLAIAETIGVLCEEAPLALLVDDLHWVDDDSFRLLEGVLSRTVAARLLVVTSSRPIRDRSLRLPHTVDVELHPISEIGTRALLASLGALPETPWATELAHALHGAGRGSPLEILETLRLALDRGSLVLDEVGWQAPDPTRLLAELGGGQAIRQRIERLDPESRWLLLALATAGSPLAHSELGGLVRHPDGLDATLNDLERRGFVHRVGDGIEPSHDAIGEGAIASESEERQQAAEAAIGRMLAGAKSISTATLVRAGRHLARAGEAAALQSVFRRLVDTARASRDPRSVASLAEEIAGDSASAKALAASLPFIQRMGVRKRWIAAAVSSAALVLLLLTSLTGGGQRNNPDQVLLVGELGGWTSKPVIEVPLRLDDWPEGAELKLEGLARAPARRSGTGPVNYVHVSPDGSSWLYSDLTGDSNTVDVALDRKGAPLRKVVSGARDDNPGQWLPDGSGFVGTTARWSPRGADDYDGFVFQLGDSSITRITSSRDHDNEFHPSPDGSRIAWSRSFKQNQPAELCWTSYDGTSGETCTHPTGSSEMMLVGWAGLDQLVYLGVSDSITQVRAINLTTGAGRTLESHAVSASSSPDGRWIAVHAQRAGAANPAWYVYPTLQPERARLLPLGNRSFRFRVAWGKSSTAHYLDRIKILGPDSIEPGTTMLYRIDGRDAEGGVHPIVLPVTWSVSDSAVGSIDSTGALTAKAPGSLRIVASVGGWRRDTLTVAVRGHPFKIVNQEDWREGLPKRWIAFGDPRPAIKTGPEGIPGFWNGGDGSFPSGAYSRFKVEGRHGVGVEALISTPITRGQWQQVVIALSGGLDSAHLGAAVHLSGLGPLEGETQGSICSVGFPGGEREAGLQWVSFSAGAQWLRANAPVSLKTGAWHQVLLQIFPDGTCGFALDGKALILSTAPVDLDQPFAVALGSSTADTKVLVGPLQVWEGIRPGVNWNALRHR